MKKFIPKEKLSKKARKELDSKNRLTWGSVNPVTRKTENKKAYNRKKARREFKNLNFLPEPLKYIGESEKRKGIEKGIEKRIVKGIEYDYIKRKL